MSERLQKYLARCGVTSRRKAETLIEAGRIILNGRPVNQVGIVVNENDEVMLDGKIVKPVTNLVYYALNKPRGVITTSEDEQGRQTVLQLVPKEPRVVACGRLDAASRGLILLTNDGDLCYQLTHPKFEHEKEYVVTATINKGRPIEERLNKLQQGVMLDDGITSLAKVKDVKRQGMRLQFNLIIHEGKNRQVRRMCSAVGLDVVDLIRTRLGNISLGNLQEGKWRKLTKAEILAE